MQNRQQKASLSLRHEYTLTRKQTKQTWIQS